MSDFRDTVQLAAEKGFFLDSCGSEERHYTWGSYIDLCGMSVEDAKKAPDACMQGGGSGSGEDGGDSTKKKATVTFVMQKGSNGEYTLYVNTDKPSASDINVSFMMNNEPHTIAIPAGSTMFNTGLQGEDVTKPYATIGNVIISSDDEEYTYKPQNSVKTGIFTLTIVKNGETTVSQVKYGEQITLTDADAREGYDFVWTDSKGQTVTSPYTMPESDATITGKYVAKEYTLTYTVKEEALENGSISQETVLSGTTTIKCDEKIWDAIKNKAAAKTGYTLDGWKIDGVAVNSATTMPASDVEAVNIYHLNAYTLTFNANGALVSSGSVYFGQTVEAPASIPGKQGYTTIGWDAEVPATMPARNLTFTAVYEVIIYYIRYYVDGTEKYVEQHIFGDNISIRANETKEGHTFSGWNPASLPATMPDEDIEVLGTFQINTYHFTALADNSIHFESDFEFGAAITGLTAPTKEGYSFDGWDGEVPATMPAHDVTVNAVFEINSYTLTYYVDGQSYHSETVDYGTQITPLADPTQEGYTFSGWDSVPATMPAHDVDVNGTFSINSYTLEYLVDGNAYTAFTVTFGETLTPIEEPEQEGYTFSGWDSVPATMPAHDVEVSGTFTINRHSILYYVDDSLFNEVSGVAYGTVISLEDAPADAVGHTFSGWTALPATMPDNDVRVDGWQVINQYTLTFMVDGAPYSSITADYGSAVSAPVPVAPVGHTFSGWDSEVPATMPAENKTFSGTMDINSWTATYVIDNEPYTSITYQYGATIVYPSVPREGYVLVWNETYQTMPDSNITITGIYEEHQVQRTVYYGMALSGTESSDVSGLSSFEFENGVETPVTFVLSGDSAYDEIETEEEIIEWEETHAFDYYILVPEGNTLLFKNSGGGVKNTILRGTVTINGDVYDQYYLEATVQEGSEIKHNMTITITEN